MGLFSTNNTDGDNEMAFDFHFPSSKKALIIFTRNPELGTCKTRLARTIGDEATLEIYKHLLKHTASVSKNLTVDRFVFYSETIKKDDIWDTISFRKKLQNGADLGNRMENAFSEIFNLGYEKVIIIGSDVLDLEEGIIADAFEKLDHHDTVIGPAKDGGYYLLGMTVFNPSLFKNKVWGTASVLQNTLKDLEKRNIFLLKELNDIDTFEDAKNYPELKKYYTNHD